ncbi:MAG TPA: archaetidylserine decarboxylase [Steroidobacteraceae bacterium]|nr:archaetidylserine decarboxylase [Steroidobacteraceae bacterium]
MTHEAPGRGIGERSFVWMQYVIPQHFISRLVYRATRSSWPWFKNRLIRWFIGRFPVDMSEAREPDASQFATFNAFFTRELRAGLRRVDPAPDAVVSPADGFISRAGPIDAETLIQAKGQAYQLADLLAGAAHWAAKFRGGSFVTVYLAPFNYHRVHVPTDATLRETWYVPGRLFSVNTATAAAVPRIFARNERIIALFDTPAGPMAEVLVGALNVGSMSTVWHGEVTPKAKRVITRLATPETGATLERGAEMGRFNMGSTVVLLFAPGTVTLDPGLDPGRVMRLGDRIGRWRART